MKILIEREFFIKTWQVLFHFSSSPLLNCSITPTVRSYHTLSVYLNSLFKKRKVKCLFLPFQYLEFPEMRIHMDNKISLILILMAGAALVSMLATLSIDHIINHDLYSYGLQFSTRWAVPYWTTVAVVFSMGWFIILTSIAFELHLVMQRLHRPSEPEVPITQVLITQQEPIQEQIQSESPRMKVEPSKKLEEEQVITTALAVKKEEEDGLSEFRVLLEEISVMTSVRATRQKAEDKPKNE
jgi:hypothetical protein